VSESEVLTIRSRSPTRGPHADSHSGDVREEAASGTAGGRNAGHPRRFSRQLSGAYRLSILPR
jgi:hypothetical protein